MLIVLQFSKKRIVNYVRYESMWYTKSCGRILILIEKFLFDIFRCESNCFRMNNTNNYF